MPQLELSTYLTQIFWVLTVFITLWLVMDRIIVPQTKEMIEARKRKYDDLILKADEINKKALASLKSYDERLSAAKLKAIEQINKNEQELKDLIAKKEHEIDEKMRQKIAESERKLAIEKEEVFNKIVDISEITAYSIIKKLELNTITLDDIRSISIKEEN